MSCLKTGCHIFLEEYGTYAFGDAFEVKGVAIFRLVEHAYKPLQSTIHYTVVNAAEWWDRNKVPSTLVALDFVNHGYDGITIQESKS